MTRIALFLLGPPRIERAGEAITVDTRKAIALMAYLAVVRQRHSRDSLAALLWPESDQSHARAALRCTLSKLNKALDGNWLEISRDTLSLRPETDLWLDVAAFGERLQACRTHPHSANATCPDCLLALTEAVQLYRGDFLAGFSLRDSQDFDDWQFYQADSLRRDLATALERLTTCHIAAGNFEPAAALARRWLALDRLHEPAYRCLMQLYTWMGQRAAALQQYRECVQTLDQELGVAPLEATTRLYQAIKESQTPPPPRSSQVTHQSAVPAPSSSGPLPAPSSTLSGYPLVGRDSERAKLIKAYTSIQRMGRVAIVQGEAGIGKTRLVEDLLAYAQGRGARVVSARCYEGETQLAYELIIAVLRAALANPDPASILASLDPASISEAARLLPELATLRPGLPTAPPLDRPGAQSRFFEGLRAILFALCQGEPGRPGVIFFDDVHWADSASLDLLAYLVHRLQEQRLYLIITWRGNALAGFEHRLHSLLSEAQRLGNVTLISLERLDQTSVHELTRLSGFTGSLVERLYRETEGLPLFLTEYLTALTRGTLDPSTENWSLPGGVRDLLRSRLREVGETGWQLLNTAAVMGRSFDFDTLREVSGRGEEEAINGLEDLLNRGLITEVSAGTERTALVYDFSHEKLRTLAYEETSLARRRLLHRRIAETLARGQRDPGMLAGQIAHHYQLAGNDAAAAEASRQAGEHARSLYANAEALAHLQMALALGHPQTASLHEVSGDLHTLMGEYSAALISYETSAALFKDQPPDLARLEQKLGSIHQRRGDWALAESYFEAANAQLTSLTKAQGQRARLYADWSLLAHHRDQLTRAQDLARQALELAEAVGDLPALAQAHNMLGIVASSQGALDEARQHLTQSLALAESLHDKSIQAAALNNLALAYAESGEVVQALDLTASALRLAVAQGDRHREAALHNNLADLLHASGQHAEAMLQLKQSVSIYAEIGVEAGTIQPEIWKLAEW